MATALQFFAAPTHLLRRSRALASMLPSLLLSGVITLVLTAVMRLMWIGPGSDFAGAWMEAWLTCWPIAFPLIYVLGPLLRRLVRSLSEAPIKRHPGLNWHDVADASAKVTANNGLTVLRNLKPNTYYVS